MRARFQPTGERRLPADGDAVLELRDVSKTFGSEPALVHALVNVSLTVRGAELVVLVGPSGAGKTTLIHLAAGLETPTAGAVSVCGQDLSRLDDERLSRMRSSRIGLVFQAFHLIDYLTA